jgi:Fic family protein
MLIPPKYDLTPEIVELLNSIDASREVIETVTIPTEIERNIRRQSTLRSSLFSARIEGNELTLEDLPGTSERQKKAEVTNILAALNWLSSRKSKDLKSKDVMTLHEMAMKGLSVEAGKFRGEQSATFNAAGIAVYLHPPPSRIEGLMGRLLKYINSSREKFAPIRACLAHYSFEKIHPFLDANGRVGRLLVQQVLAQGGYGMKGLLAFEEYVDNHRSEYYRALEEPEKEVTDYLFFMLMAIGETAKKAKEMVLAKQEAKAVDFLLPRRAEIYEIIREQKMVNFDQIRRRFMKVNPRTLRYDLKKLAEGGLIVKLGTTRGVYYRAAK